MKTNLQSSPTGTIQAFIRDLGALRARAKGELGEDPHLNPATLLSRSHAEYD